MMWTLSQRPADCGTFRYAEPRKQVLRGRLFRSRRDLKRNKPQSDSSSLIGDPPAERHAEQSGLPSETAVPINLEYKRIRPSGQKKCGRVHRKPPTFQANPAVGAAEVFAIKTLHPQRLRNQARMEKNFQPICWIIAVANSEHFTSFAPLISRAKS